MRKIADIHTFEDPLFQRWMVRASGVVVVAGVVLVVALYVAVAFMFPASLDPELANLLWGGGLQGGGLGLVTWLGAVAVGTFATLPVHEAVHAIFFKAFAPAGTRITFGANWKAGMLYACADGIVYTRAHYLVIAGAPSVVVTILLMGLGCAFGHPVLGCILAVLHLAGCTGDWGYIRAIVRDPSITHCEDTSWGVQFYGAGDEPDGEVGRP